MGETAFCSLYPRPYWVSQYHNVTIANVCVEFGFRRNLNDLEIEELSALLSN